MWPLKWESRTFSFGCNRLKNKKNKNGNTFEENNLKKHRVLNVDCSFYFFFIMLTQCTDGLVSKFLSSGVCKFNQCCEAESHIFIYFYFLNIPFYNSLIQNY